MRQLLQERRICFRITGSDSRRVSAPATRAVPTVFVGVADPIGSRLIESWSRPGGNLTGFTNFLPTMGGKWLETLREIAPTVNRAAFRFNSHTAPLCRTLFS